ncbi:MAG: hypothetical protein NVSMB64_02100 [Candidatus Velthaea sp.]
MDWRFIVDLSSVSALVLTLAVVFAMRARIGRDRVLIALLQDITRTRRRILPAVSIGSRLISATSGAKIGGDIIDVFDLDGRYGMFVVADVSGKGLAAAVDTAFIKFTLRALVVEIGRNPGRVLTKFNQHYMLSIDNAESFVVLVLGIIDTQLGIVQYASAGHEPAYLRSQGNVSLMQPTGPIVGCISDASYRSETVLLGRGDSIVLATDGLTESRDRKGMLLGAQGLAQWIIDVRGGASDMADALIERLRARTHGRINDDVALLIVRFEPSAVEYVEPVSSKPSLSIVRTVSETLQVSPARDREQVDKITR